MPISSVCRRTGHFPENGAVGNDFRTRVLRQVRRGSRIAQPCGMTSVSIWRTVGLLAVCGVMAVPAARAQATDVAGAVVAGNATESVDAAAGASVASSTHMFGILPNYATVEEGGMAPRLTAKQMFRMAALGSFDPYVFPFVGVVAGIHSGSPQPYAQRYATAMADNAIGNFLTSAIMPLAAGQDSRYFQSGRGSVARRVAYAASRSVITRSRSGRSQFNVSEIGGNAIAAGLSNLYYAPAERTLTGTLGRWAMQVVWDTVSNEMKEFWPDIRHKLHHD